MRFLSREEALRIHSRVLDETPPGVPIHAGVRHLGAIEAALARCRRGPFEVGDLAERAALMMHGTAQDHPFEDGNKRTAYAMGFAFLDLNGAALVAADRDVEALMFRIALGEIDIGDIADWIRARMDNA